MMNEKIAVMGLGYVGLPLAVALAKEFDVVGFDISAERVDSLRSGTDWTNEVPEDELRSSGVNFSSDPSQLAGRTLFIVTVPTPIDGANRPDFGAMLMACEIVGPALTPGSVVVFESTVYPGVTEEICAPALEKASGLRCGADFKIGYSPERINPGDRDRPLHKITKVVAGQDQETLDRLAAVYGAIIEAGIHRASSIKVAEAAKVIENTQRDVNIALMNEISKICDLVGIRTSEVLEAAGTKWNFLKFYPGLVGGHCIGVDPYYLTAKAEQLGYHPRSSSRDAGSTTEWAPMSPSGWSSCSPAATSRSARPASESSDSRSRRMCPTSATPRSSTSTRSFSPSGSHRSCTIPSPIPTRSAAPMASS
jgi:UDP-N-acetyl-D-galactosamine dehydrogenase